MGAGVLVGLASRPSGQQQYVGLNKSPTAAPPVFVSLLRRPPRGLTACARFSLKSLGPPLARELVRGVLRLVPKFFEYIINIYPQARIIQRSWESP